ncbi:hypothetical protein U6A24_00640 [Aquimarina gracilis]|uniref:Anti-sigma factor n=1 Tax=Aquimarina gracilis TaxID=874422 RepID=A0ABU5ZRE7_9FLAO|nr:hypothetical protein [Aquimarina gracilis]MEB3343942.1 hypothetical protein [Aquimarina gracilis]
MAPLKFEEKIKEKLEQRAIEPSMGSWEKLSGQLDQVQNQKKGNKMIWWYSLAAVFVGVLILTSLFYNPVSEDVNPQFVDRTKENTEQKDTEIVQENKEEPPQIIEKENVVIDIQKSKDEVVDVSESNTKLIKKGNEGFSKVTPDSAPSKDIDEQPKEVTEIAQTNEETVDLIEQKQKQEISINREIIDNKVADIVAKVEELQKNNTEVTDEEINALLRKAQRDITTQKILKSNTVSASALLQDVEEEIDETFKQRVFEALKAGFQKVKTAVAEREN